LSGWRGAGADPVGALQVYRASSALSFVERQNFNKNINKMLTIAVTTDLCLLLCTSARMYWEFPAKTGVFPINTY
jgi:hypothetical protein